MVRALFATVAVAEVAAVAAVTTPLIAILYRGKENYHKGLND
jgi:hypothetical protein